MTELSARELSRRTLMKSAAASAAAGAITAASLQGMAQTASAQEPVEGGTLSIGVSQITSNSHMLHLRHFAGSENIYTRDDRIDNANQVTAPVPSRMLARHCVALLRGAVGQR